jgi:hypothetical protein
MVQSVEVSIKRTPLVNLELCNLASKSLSTGRKAYHVRDNLS